jgi:hypothetical protein
MHVRMASSATDEALAGPGREGLMTGTHKSPFGKPLTDDERSDLWLVVEEAASANDPQTIHDGVAALLLLLRDEQQRRRRS